MALPSRFECVRGIRRPARSSSSLTRPLHWINSPDARMRAFLCQPRRSSSVQTRTIDGQAIAREFREGLMRRVGALASKGVRPGLAVVQVGNHPASKVYVRNKIRACSEVGLHSEHIELPGNTDEEALLERIRSLNNGARIHGILVQLPLPPGFSVDRVQETIAPEKDVDGFHPINVGLLAVGRPRFAPCTPLGVMRLLEHEKIDPEGRHAV